MGKNPFLSDQQVIDALVTSHDPEALWAKLIAVGTPLVAPTGEEMTFLFAVDDQDEAIHLWINRLTDKQRHHHGVMHRAGDLPYWAKTVTVPPRLLASYCFRKTSTGHRPPGHNAYPHWADPTARNGQVVHLPDCPQGTSLLLGAKAQVSAVWENIAPTAPTRVIREQVGGLDGFLYLPATAWQSLPVITLIDADVWFERLRLDQALDRAIAGGILPPCAVVGVGFSSSKQRGQLLDPRRDLVTEIIDPLLAFAHRKAAQYRSSLSDGELILAGQSLGGLAAAAAASRHPTRMGHLIVSSPSLWWHPDPTATPADIAGQIMPWILGTLTDLQPLKSVHVSVGLQEGMLVPHVVAFTQALRDHGIDENAAHLRMYDGGHDVAWWREELISALGKVLATTPPAHM